MWGGRGGKEKRGQEVQGRQKKVSAESRNLKVAGSAGNRKKNYTTLHIHTFQSKSIK